MPKERSYGERFTTLTQNLARRREKGEDTLIHISKEPVNEPFLEPFQEVNQMRLDIASGKVKTNPNHWKPVDPIEKQLETSHLLGSFPK